MRYTLLFSILLLITWSCTKTKFSSTPSLKFESVNTTQLHQKVVPNCLSSSGDEVFLLPVFPTTKDQKGKINVSLNYNDIAPQCAPQNDTATFRFVLKDDAKHVSDTASSPVIIIYN